MPVNGNEGNNSKVWKIVCLGSWCENAGSILGQRLRRWPNIEPALDCATRIVYFSTLDKLPNASGVPFTPSRELHPKGEVTVTLLLQDRPQ